ncbi:beta-lactamase/transpeptidase-like protein [Lophiostoma macrostomum CBS 122681]|uniref:Beta-lactamase/transpeptidase-like protein n=1 Tax=Lophiostoma macrostomum CBS 122681 TaxID=1314788 RepID=A0A6A6TET1_9PLEO|nr:beta-lactamase/transpeptidase-like protein [Lophiostoma macrostomum CBS 122681]
MPLSTQAVENVKSILDGATGAGKSGAPGLAFIAIDKSGKSLIEHASGTKSINSKEPIDMDTTLWIASFTKLVTIISCLQLVEQGKLDLDDPECVKKYAPEIGKKKVYPDGVTPMDQEKAVTLRMLLSHTAGFAYAFLDPRPTIHTRPLGICEFSGEIQEYLGSPLVNQPGSMWEYSISIDWAGIMLERALNVKLGDYFKEHVFKPLGIEHATMFPTKEMRANLAYMHARDGEGNLQERDHLYKAPFFADTPEKQKAAFQSGGAGLYAKPKEYAKILAALLNDGTSPTTGNKILDKKTVDLMWENHIPNQPNFGRGGPAPADPFLAGPTPEMYPQEGSPPQGWNLAGMLTIEPAASGRGRNTAWWAGLANCFWWVDRERGVAGVIGAQVLPFGDPKVFGTWMQVEKAVYDGLE